MEVRGWLPFEGVVRCSGVSVGRAWESNTVAASCCQIAPVVVRKAAAPTLTVAAQTAQTGSQGKTFSLALHQFSLWPWASHSHYLQGCVWLLCSVPRPPKLESAWESSGAD